MQAIGNEVYDLRERSFTKRCYYLVYLFMAGLFLGILAVNIGHDLWITEDGLLNYGMLEQMKRSVPEGAGLLEYIVRQRMLIVGMIGIFSMTVIGIPAVCGYVVYLGITTGCFLSVAIVRYGIRGLLLAISGILPQGLLLVPGYLMLFCWGMEFNRILYGQGGYRGLTGTYGSGIWLKKGFQMVLIILVVITGCVIESYVNPKLLNFILNIL